jgi:hypothetical protein
MYYINKKDSSIAEVLTQYPKENTVMLQIGRCINKVVSLNELKTEWTEVEGERP